MPRKMHENPFKRVGSIVLPPPHYTPSKLPYFEYIQEKLQGKISSGCQHQNFPIQLQTGG